MGSHAGRVEAALDKDLATRREIPGAERAALRAQARAVDVAEVKRDSDGVTRANAVYLQLRAAAGLSAKGERQGDAWDKVLAEAMRPTPGTSDTAHT
jgi:hypothetical protein